MLFPSNGARVAFPWTRHRSMHEIEEINARWQITADYNRCMYTETQCNTARKTTYLAANSPSPCMFPLKIGYLIFSLQWKYICSFSIDCRTLEDQQGPHALCPTIITEAGVWPGCSWAGSEPPWIRQYTRTDELKEITKGNSLPWQQGLGPQYYVGRESTNSNTT